MQTNKKSKLYGFAIILFLSLLIGLNYGCNKNNSVTNSGNNSNPGNQNTIVMQNIAFSPASKTITAGTTLTWTNMDPVNHTVTSGTPGSPDGKFDSGNIGSNGTYSHKFDAAGTYNYYCRIHGSAMTGTIIVQ